jgi:CRP/FNR family transcriptional regulator, dissimilatory nitrate respiration regulator
VNRDLTLSPMQARRLYCRESPRFLEVGQVRPGRAAVAHIVHRVTCTASRAARAARRRTGIRICMRRASGEACQNPAVSDPGTERSDRPDLPWLLSRLPLFHELSAAQINSIASDTRARHLPKGEILFHQGDQPHGFFVVIEGQLKLGFASAQGNEKVVEIIGPRQSFGEAVMFMARPYPVFAQALTDAWILQIAQQTVFDLLATDTSFARAMLAGLSRRLHSLIGDVEAYSLRSGAQRVIGYLLQQCADQDVAGDEPSVNLPISKHVLASRLNLTPETLSRVLHDLVSSKLISVQGRQVTIHGLQKLRDFGL